MLYIRCIYVVYTLYTRCMYVVYTLYTLCIYVVYSIASPTRNGCAIILIEILLSRKHGYHEWTFLDQLETFCEALSATRSRLLSHSENGQLRRNPGTKYFALTNFLSPSALGHSRVGSAQVSAIVWAPGVKKRAGRAIDLEMRRKGSC